jgi:hypothetical protein
VKTCIVNSRSLSTLFHDRHAPGSVLMLHVSSVCLRSQDIVQATEDASRQRCVQALLHRLLTNCNKQEAACACQLFEALSSGNSDGQVAWTAMLPLSGTPKPLTASQSFGEMLLAGLMSDVSDNALPGTASFAYTCAVLASLVRGNEKAQHRVLTAQIDVRAGRLSATKKYNILNFIMLQLGRAWSTCSSTENSSHTASGPPSGSCSTGGLGNETEKARSRAASWAVPAALSLVIALTDNSADGVVHLLQDAAHVPLLLEMIQSSGGSHTTLVRGLAAIVCGCCLLPSPASPQAPHRKRGALAAAVVDVLLNRLGIREFFAVLEGLLDTDEMQVC